VCSLSVHSAAYWYTDRNSCRGRPAYDKIIGYIQKAKDAGGEILIGGVGRAASVIIRDFSDNSAGDDSKGYFVQPTIILTNDPHSITMEEEIFGPVITVMVIHRNEASCTYIFFRSTCTKIRIMRRLWNSLTTHRLMR
jgi:1-pyrroline-5-carboxylate dehydrogenase